MSMLPGYHVKNGGGRTNAKERHLREAARTERAKSRNRVWWVESRERDWQEGS